MRIPVLLNGSFTLDMFYLLLVEVSSVMREIKNS